MASNLRPSFLFRNRRNSTFETFHVKHRRRATLKRRFFSGLLPPRGTPFTTSLLPATQGVPRSRLNVRGGLPAQIQYLLAGFGGSPAPGRGGCPIVNGCLSRWFCTVKHCVYTGYAHHSARVTWDVTHCTRDRPDGSASHKRGSHCRTVSPLFSRQNPCMSGHGVEAGREVETTC